MGERWSWSIGLGDIVYFQAKPHKHPMEIRKDCEHCLCMPNAWWMRISTAIILLSIRCWLLAHAHPTICQDKPVRHGNPTFCSIVRPNEWIGWGWRCAWPAVHVFSCLFCIQCLDCGDLKSIVCFTFWYVHGRVCEFPSHIELTSSILDQIWSVYVQTESPDRSGFVFKKSHDLSWPSCFIKSAWLTWGDHLVVCSAGNSSCWETQSRLSRVQHDGRPCKM